VTEMKALCLFVLCLGLAHAIAPARFMERRRRVFVDVCGGGLTPQTCGTDGTSKYDPGTGKYTGMDSAVDGHDTTGETPDATLVDHCHIEPALCNDGPGTAFCARAKAAGKDICCPHASAAGVANQVKVGKILTKGCGAKAVNGMARLFMPQVTSKAKLIEWVTAKAAQIPGTGGAAFAVTEKQDVGPGDYKFAQGEIKSLKILGMACAAAKDGQAVAFPNADAKDDPWVCEGDKFVLDGHHRFGAFRFFNLHLQAKSGKPAIAQFKVNKLNINCVDLIAELAKLVDWSNTVVWDGATGKYTAPTPAAFPVADAGVQFSGLLELEARFGASIHASVAVARKAYMQETNQVLANAGVAMKGGDEALGMHFDRVHAPVLFP